MVADYVFPEQCIHLFSDTSIYPSKCLLVCVSVIAGVLNEIAGRPSAHQPASVFAASVPHNPPRH